MSHSPLSACLALLALWGLIGAAGLLRPASLRFVGRTLFPLGAASGAALAVVAASMGFVLLANDAYAFMVAWETMALSSYFLVTTQHSLAEIRSAGFLCHHRQHRSGLPANQQVVQSLLQRARPMTACATASAFPC